MARPGHAYPQVEPGARALMDRRIASGRPGQRVGEALRTARRARAHALVLGSGSAVGARDLERAGDWGLHALPVGRLAWTGLPVLDAGASEVRARRLLLGGAPMILVRERGRIAGVIDGAASSPAPPARSEAPRLERAEDRMGAARLWLLQTAGKLGEGMGSPVFATGGFVRDLLLGRRAPDVDLVVEGDGVALGRRLSEESGGHLVVHPGFGTASLEGGSAPDGTRLDRVDLASARRERYAAPGALPAVAPAPLEEDLRRRDFSVNAMALALGTSAFGRLVDPLGGRADLRARRLRPLHPLSFVEDPTRIFRAARYAARLGFRLDPLGQRALALALAVGEYPALSGQRLRAELDLLGAEAEARQGFALLLRWGALRLWHRGYRATPRAPGRLRAAARLLGWARRAGVALDPAEVFLVALLLDQPAAVAARCLERLAITGQPRAALGAASEAARLARRLGRPALRPSAAADALRAHPAVTLAAAWLRGGPRARRRIEWFFQDGRTARPRLTGEAIVALGVPRGPAVGECLAALRRLRLDGVTRTPSAERRFVEEWLGRRRDVNQAGQGGTR
jgi:tRNA nucleotidyltransferase (CCA-adding enzyme)